MLEGLAYAGSRSIIESGGSKAVTLPKRELEEAGIDLEELQNSEVFCKVQDGKFIVDLDTEKGLSSSD